MSFIRRLFRRQTPEEYFQAIGREDYMALSSGERAAKENGWSILRYNDLVQIRDSAGNVMHEHHLENREEWYQNKRLIKAQMALAAMRNLAS